MNYIPYDFAFSLAEPFYIKYTNKKGAKKILKMHPNPFNNLKIVDDEEYASILITYVKKDKIKVKHFYIPILQNLKQIYDIQFDIMEWYCSKMQGCYREYKVGSLPFSKMVDLAECTGDDDTDDSLFFSRAECILRHGNYIDIDNTTYIDEILFKRMQTINREALSRKDLKKYVD